MKRRLLIGIAIVTAIILTTRVFSASETPAPLDQRHWNRLTEQMYGLHRQGKKLESLDTAKELLRLATIHYPETDIRYIESIHHVGWLNYDLQRHREAEYHLKRSLRLYEAQEERNKRLPKDQRVSAPGDHGIGNEKALLGSVCYSLGKVDEAIEYYRGSLKALKVMGNDQRAYHDNIAKQLAAIYRRAGREKEAAELEQ